MIMERQGPGPSLAGPSLAAAVAALRERAHDMPDVSVSARSIFLSTNLSPDELAQLDLSNKSSLKALVAVVPAIAMALITCVVVLRLTVRRHSVGRFFVDDYLVILASVFTIVLCSVVIAATKYGLGQHVWNLDLAYILDNLKVCIQLMFVGNIFYAAAIAFTKLSIIASYLHIFSPHGFLKALLYATAAVTIGLGVASIPATIFECIPVAGAWTLMDNDAHCYTFVNFLYASTAINVTTDLILCIVPIPMFWRLQLPRRQKIMISVLFFLGGFACIASIVRLAYLHLLYDPIDVTHDLVSSVMWTIAECTIGIVCVSLPPLRSLFAKLLPSIFGNPHSDNNSSQGAGGAGDGGAGSDSTAGYGSRLKTPLSPDSPQKPFSQQHSTRLSKSKLSNNSSSNRGVPPLSQKSAEIIVLKSLTSRHSRHSLHSSYDEDGSSGGGGGGGGGGDDDDDDDDDEDASSTRRFAQKISRGAPGSYKRSNSTSHGHGNGNGNGYERRQYSRTGVSVKITAGSLPDDDNNNNAAREVTGPNKRLPRLPTHDVEMGLVRPKTSSGSMPNAEEARLESAWDGRRAS